MDKAEIRNPYDLIPYITKFKQQCRLHGEIMCHDRQRKWYVDQFPEPNTILSTNAIDGTLYVMKLLIARYVEFFRNRNAGIPKLFKNC
jgi:hypothetical protein